MSFPTYVLFTQKERKRSYSSTSWIQKNKKLIKDSIPEQTDSNGIIIKDYIIFIVILAHTMSS